MGHGAVGQWGCWGPGAVGSLGSSGYSGESVGALVYASGESELHSVVAPPWSTRDHDSTLALGSQVEVLAYC